MIMPVKNQPKSTIIRELVYPILAIGFNLAILAMHLGAQWFIDGTAGVAWMDSETAMIVMFALVYGALRIDPPSGLFGQENQGSNDQ